MDKTKGELTEDIGVIVENRKPTNVLFFQVFGVIIFLWCSLYFYFLCYGSLRRIEEVSPTAYNTLKDCAFNIKLGFGRICFACSFAFVFCSLLITYIHRFAGLIVRCIVILVVLSLASLTVAMWYVHRVTHIFTIGVPIVAAVITLVTTIIILAIRKHIRMMIRLFKEGGKVAQSMPWILVQPFMVFVIFITTLFLALYFVPLILSVGLKEPNEITDKSRLHPNNWMKLIVFINFLVVCWIFHFLMGCQHVIIAGATANWYFTRDKTHIRGTMTTSYKYLFKYHLGSVAFGSLIITFLTLYKLFVLKPIRILVRCGIRVMSWILKCIIIVVTRKAYLAMGQFGQFMIYIDHFFVFLNRNAYIEIAIYGDGFIKSGKRVYRVLTDNSTKVLAVNSVGGFIMVLGRFLVTGFGLFIGCVLIEVEEDGFTEIGYPVCVIAVVSLVIAHVFFSAFEMVVDSVFICFCEDCDMNDGVQRPYYMSEEMMVFINDGSSKMVPILRKQLNYAG